MLNIFIGYDHRQPVHFTTLVHSIISQASVPVSITPLILPQINNVTKFDRCGLTPFTYTRFLVPYLSNYEGWSLFLDIDIILRDDIKKLFDLADDNYAIMVSKNKKRFEWASVMLFNNAKCKILTPEYVNDPSQAGLHRIQWVQEHEIGELPSEWNHLVGYDEPRNDAKLVHFTQAMPSAFEAERCEYSDDWRAIWQGANSVGSWDDLMGSSNHAKEVNGIRVPVYLEGDELLRVLSKKTLMKLEKNQNAQGANNDSPR